MKHFCEVFFIALALILYVAGLEVPAIAAGAAAGIAWFWPLKENRRKSALEIRATATGEKLNTGTLNVEYSFKAAPEEKFTADIYHYGEFDADVVLTKLVDHITEHTGIPVEGDRLSILKIKAV